MNNRPAKIYRFRSFLLDVGERQLFDGDREIALTPKSFDVLVHLVENAGHLVYKNDLMRAVWPDSFVEEINIPRAIHHLRRVLKQDETGTRFIETVPTKGYRFLVPVVRLSGDPAKAAQFERGEATAAEFGSTGRAAVPEEFRGRSAFVTARWAVSSLPKRPILIGGLLTILLALGSFWYIGSSQSSFAGTRSHSPPTNSSGAYRLYLEGKFILDRRYENHPKEALLKFEEAISLDPDFALAYAGKADAEWRFFIRHTQSHDDIARARASLNRALELDPASSYAHTVKCRVFTTFDWDFKNAEIACRRAVQLDPNSHDARHELAMFLTQFGRHEEALAQIDAAITLAPTSFNRRNRAVILFNQKRYDEGIKELEEIKSSDPESPHWLSWLWWMHAMKGDHDKALDAYIAWQGRLGRPEADVELRSVYSAQGWAGVQREMVRKFRPGESGALHLEALRCQMGEMDDTFGLLEMALKNRTLWLIHLKTDPRFDPCRNDPRFDEILKRVGLM